MSWYGSVSFSTCYFLVGVAVGFTTVGFLVEPPPPPFLPPEDLGATAGACFTLKPPPEDFLADFTLNAVTVSVLVEVFELYSGLYLIVGTKICPGIISPFTNWGASTNSCVISGTASIKLSTLSFGTCCYYTSASTPIEASKSVAY